MCVCVLREVNKRNAKKAYEIKPEEKIVSLPTKWACSVYRLFSSSCVQCVFVLARTQMASVDKFVLCESLCYEWINSETDEMNKCS